MSRSADSYARSVGLGAGTVGRGQCAMCIACKLSTSEQYPPSRCRAASVSQVQALAPQGRTNFGGESKEGVAVTRKRRVTGADGGSA
ncbi:hypothetical protein RR42_s1179 [Cupriavidus basilensis]|uniref:Uncharacterized protein n=1 Tax=Cupriavidus basilensis TaxID=68895 RepID=A0A0C4YID2_9BURK|nr:hypothetical protein RR42_s1179 [Cupriavidus basilensis]